MKIVKKSLLISMTAIASMAAHSAKYTVLDLGTNDGSYSAAYGINNNGDVVGAMAGPVYVPDTPCNGIDLFYPDCVNVSDWIDEDRDGVDDDGIYSAIKYPYHGFIFDASTNTIEDVDSIGENPDFNQDISLVTKINDSKTAAGFSISSNESFSDYIQESIAAFTGQARENYYTAYGSGKIFIYGGEVDGSPSSETWKYTVSSQEWIQLEDTPVAFGKYAATFSNTSDFYIAGGVIDEEGSKALWSFNFIAETWEQRTDLPTDFVIGGHLLNVENQLTYFGGAKSADALETSNQFYQYNLTEGTWTEIVDDSLSTIKSLAFAKIFSLHSRLYFTMGISNGSCSNEVWSVLTVPADIETDRERYFSVKQHDFESPKSIIDTRNVFAFNSRGYVIGGKECGTDQAEGVTEILEFVPRIGKWFEVSQDRALSSEMSAQSSNEVFINILAVENTQISLETENTLAIKSGSVNQVYERQFSGDSSNYLSINATGDTVGYAINKSDDETTFAKNAAYFESGTNEITFVPAFDELSEFESQFNGVNDNMIAVGWADYLYDERFKAKKALVFDKNTQTISAIEPIRNDDVSSVAMDINNQGAIVGYSSKPVFGAITPDTEAFVKNGDEITLLGQLAEQFEYSVAHAINEAGQIVGDAQNAFATQIIDSNGFPSFAESNSGFIYENGTMVDLNTYLSCEAQKSYNIVSARDINDSGQIAVVMLHTSVDDDGKAVSQLKAGRLDPVTNGTVEDCSETEEKKKKSGAIPLVFIVMMALMMYIRRRRVA